MTVAAIAHRYFVTSAVRDEMPDGATSLQALHVAAQPAWTEVVVVAAIGAAAWAIAGAVAGKPAWLRWAAGGFAAFWLLVLALFGVAHLELSLSTHFGLSWPFLREGFKSGENTDAIAHARPDEVVRAALAPLAFGASWWLLRGPRGRRAVQLAVASLSAVLLLASGAGQLRRAPPLPDAVPACANLAPLYYFAGTLLDGVATTRTANAAPWSPVAGAKLAKAHPRNAVQADGGAPEDGPEDDPAPLPASASDHADAGMRLRDPAFVRANADLRKQLPNNGGKRWNVVWLVLESTGLRYALGKVTPADKPPMPYLNHLASEGWLLQRHHSTSNSSAISMVSMLTSLYPSPTHYSFATRRDIAFPSAATLLPGLTRAMLVTPGKLNYYFPHGFLKNSGFADIEGYDDVPVKKDAVVQGTGRDEIATVDHFLRKVDKLQPPYLAVYYSFVAHWDYANYGPQWRRYPSSRTLDRYLNNLWLLDNLIAKIVAHLKKTGRADDTVLVICGDHGEAFGQHEGNWSHPFAIYEENLETPAVLWQPALFKPRVEERLTGHIDLLPTLLDAVGATWDRALLQGESLFQAELERKYLFGFGKDGAVFALDPAGPKIQLPREGLCSAYDLKSDPSERRKLPCERYGDMLVALKKWKAWHRAAIAAHSKATLAATGKGPAAGKAPASPK